MIRIDHLRVQAIQLQHVLDVVRRSQRPFTSHELVEVLVAALPRVVDSGSVAKLVSRNLSERLVLELRLRLGAARNPSAGTRRYRFSQFYVDSFENGRRDWRWGFDGERVLDQPQDTCVARVRWNLSIVPIGYLKRTEILLWR